MRMWWVLGTPIPPSVHFEPPGSKVARIRAFTEKCSPFFLRELARKLALKCGQLRVTAQVSRTTITVLVLAHAARSAGFAGKNAHKCENSRKRVARATSLPKRELIIWEDTLQGG